MLSVRGKSLNLLLTYLFYMELARSLDQSKTKTDISKKQEIGHILERYGYTEILSENVRKRRTLIKKAIRKDSFNSVYYKLEALEKEIGKEYKKERLRGDMNWLKSTSQRYNQTIFSNQ